MKKVLNLQFLTIVFLSFSMAFISCETKKKKNSNTVATSFSPSEEINTIPIYREPLVFITGKKQDVFYTNAKKYYENKQFEVITEAFSLQEIILWLNANYDDRLYSDIHIVSKSNPWGGLDMEPNINSGNLTIKRLKTALIDRKIPQLKNGIPKETNFIFDASTLGNNPELLETLKAALSSNVSPNIIATPFYNNYGGTFSDHNLAKPYFGFYPTAQSPGKTDLSKEFAKKYPNEKEIDWYNALNNEVERYVGDAYTIQYNFPVQWEFSYNGDEEVPYFENAEEIMTWIQDNEELYNEIKAYNIPLEKFRWDSKTKRDKLIIKGITTVLCVLKPLIKPYGDLQHIEPEISNLRLYNIK